MPRAVTRAISTSFAVDPHAHSRGSSLNYPMSKAPSILDMFSSPRPSKASQSSKVSALSSSPSNRKMTASSAPFTTPPKKEGKRKRTANDDEEDNARNTSTWDRAIKNFFINYDMEMSKEIQTARRALEMSLMSAKGQMEVSILAYPRSTLAMRVEDFINGAPARTSDPSKFTKDSQVHSGTAQLATNKKPRIAKPGEVVYSARGSPIMIQRLFGNGGVIESSDVEEEEEEDEPSFDTASDKSGTSESFSLPDVAALTRKIQEEERKKILSSEGIIPRSSSKYYRSSSSS